MEQQVEIHMVEMVKDMVKNNIFYQSFIFYETPSVSILFTDTNINKISNIQRNGFGNDAVTGYSIDYLLGVKPYCLPVSVKYRYDIPVVTIMYVSS